MAKPNLLLGPLLRYVDATSATIWVETDRACTVEVAGTSTPTFRVRGHHYAMAILRDLPAGSSIPYEVHLDGVRVWPDPRSHYPPSTIRTHASEHRSALRLAFGSCRHAGQLRGPRRHRFGEDALDAYAVRMARLPESEWADALLLLGDQVYADDTSPEVQRKIKARRSVREPPGTEVADFEEYTWLYHETWSDPDIRWLLSTVPTSMIFDDHDVHDDWNTSRAWRQRMDRRAWWFERERGALVSYWVYQHLGNLTPDELSEDELFARVRRAGRDGDAIGVLREFAEQADTEVDGVKPFRFSYRRDFGDVRLVVIDTRCGRILEGGHRRQMISDRDFAWLGETTRGDYTHLVVGSSLPWLMPHAVHHIESANEKGCERPGVRGRWSETVRQAIDLEHWPAFRSSFDTLAALLGAVARGERTERAPATVTVLSGDVHHSFVAEAHYPGGTRGRVWQLTCSPVHNYVHAVVRLAFRVSWSAVAAALAHTAARLRGVPPLALRWRKTSGPSFHNQIAVLHLDGRDAGVTFHPSAEGRKTVTVPLTAGTVPS